LGCEEKGEGLVGRRGLWGDERWGLVRAGTGRHTRGDGFVGPLGRVTKADRGEGCAGCRVDGGLGLGLAGLATGRGRGAGIAWRDLASPPRAP
jgi:hypothetical protein